MSQSTTGIRCERHDFDPGVLREYDIRGVYGETLSERDAYAVGRSFATRLRRTGGRLVAVGYDGRLSSSSLETALILGLTDGGVDVRRVGLGPTPLLYYAVASGQGVDGGIQVTGSHNPKDHNGFKIVLGGQPFFGDDIFDLARLAAAGDWSVGRGIVDDVDLGDAYLDRIVQALDGIDPGVFDTWRIGWDTGNGAAGPLVQRLVRRLPGRHHVFFAEVDGHFPNHHPDPTVPANLADLIAAVMAGNIDFGFAFDGDGDRLGLVDSRGRIVWGDQILLILAEDLLRRVPGARIMADVKTSQVVFDRIAALGGEPVLWKTGHSLIKSGMKQKGAILAGEMTGHLFFADTFEGYDDALYAALRVMAACARLGRTPTELRDAMPETFATPELRLTVPGTDPATAMTAVLSALRNEGAVFDAIDGARVRHADGWWLLRPSNTQAMLSARAESTSAAGLERVLADLDCHLAAAGVSR